MSRFKKKAMQILFSLCIAVLMVSGPGIKLPGSTEEVPHPARDERGAPEHPEPGVPDLETVYPLPVASIYTYGQMTAALQAIQEAYPDLVETGIIGHSIEGRPLWSASLGKGDGKVLLIGSSHAREWLTTPLLLRTLEAYAREYSRSGQIDGHPVRPILDRYTFVFVPMQNPDGVTLSQFGLAAVVPEKHEQLLAMKTVRSDNFTRWKANIAGVDLNRQHSAGPGAWAFYRDTNAENPGNPGFKITRGPNRKANLKAGPSLP